MFVDIHNHILPGVDDGPKDLETALNMAQKAVEGGTDIMVATPHRAYFLRRDAPRAWVIDHVQSLQDALDKAGILLKVVPGVEIQFGPAVVADLTSQHLCTLGDAGTWALIEPPFEGLPDSAFSTIEQLSEAGINVVLAHPERNSEVQRDLAFVRGCVLRGCVLQITTGSLLGDFGPKALRAAEGILSNHLEWPIVIASDSHDPEHRRTNLMAAARDMAARIVGQEAAQAMVDSRPRSLVESTESNQK